MDYVKYKLVPKRNFRTKTADGELPELYVCTYPFTLIDFDIKFL